MIVFYNVFDNLACQTKLNCGMSTDEYLQLLVVLPAGWPAGQLAAWPGWLNGWAAGQLASLLTG